MLHCIALYPHHKRFHLSPAASLLDPFLDGFATMVELVPFVEFKLLDFAKRAFAQGQSFSRAA